MSSVLQPDFNAGRLQCRPSAVRICFSIIFPLVESEALVRAFNPSSTLEPELKAFRRRGRNSLGRPLPFSPSW
jgi:hypothetical protein